MIELHERVYLEDGKHVDFVEKFPSKAFVIKRLKKGPYPNQTIYELKKHDESEFVFKGAKRRFQLVEVPE